jgi:aspartate 1-decarboxylase
MIGHSIHKWRRTGKMELILLKSKIHRAQITDANLNYEGSIAIDSALMEASKIVPYERVEVANLNNGYRFSTYAIEGEKKSGEICLNGATARLGEPGDLIIIFTYTHLSPEEITEHRPIILHMGENNKITSIQK